jgi:hypothetical protein
MVLQMCVIKHDTETYYSFRKYINKGDEVPLIYCLDAYALEIEGKTDQAKAIIDQHKETSTDYHLLSNILGFYVRNNYLDDAKQLFLIILSKSKKQEIFIDEKEDFFGRAITFFTKNKSLVVKEFIEASENDLSENENIWRVKAQFYESISDLPNLLECLNWLYQQTKNFDFGYNRVVCNFQLMNYGSALEEAHSLLSTISEGNIAERVRVIWLISNINLFLENEDESYEWAKKAADQDNAFGQYLRGVCHENGYGREGYFSNYRDRTKALVWYRKSAAQGYEAAKEKVQELSSGVSIRRRSY